MRSLFWAGISAALLFNPAHGAERNCRQIAIKFQSQAGISEQSISETSAIFVSNAGSSVKFECRNGLDSTATVISEGVTPGPDWYFLIGMAGNSITDDDQFMIMDAGQSCMVDLAGTSEWSISKDVGKTRINCSLVKNATAVIRKLN